MKGSIRVLIEAVLAMYDGLSTKTLDLMREGHERQKIAEELLHANLQLHEVNIRLEELAITNQLTNLFNRRHFNNVVKRELKRANREKNAFLS